jgi:hypothetical protein
MRCLSALVFPSAARWKTVTIEFRFWSTMVRFVHQATINSLISGDCPYGIVLEHK